MIGDAEATLDDGILTLRVDLRPEPVPTPAAPGTRPAPGTEAPPCRSPAVVHAGVLHAQHLGPSVAASPAPASVASQSTTSPTNQMWLPSASDVAHLAVEPRRRPHRGWALRWWRRARAGPAWCPTPSAIHVGIDDRLGEARARAARCERGNRIDGEHAALGRAARGSPTPAPPPIATSLGVDGHLGDPADGHEVAPVVGARADAHTARSAWTTAPGVASGHRRRRHGPPAPAPPRRARRAHDAVPDGDQVVDAGLSLDVAGARRCASSSPARASMAALPRCPGQAVTPPAAAEV